MSQQNIQLTLYYQAPYNWECLYQFLLSRYIPQLESCDNGCYGRYIQWENTQGYFSVKPSTQKNALDVSITLDTLDHLQAITDNIRRVFDTDVDIEDVENNLRPYFSPDTFTTGLRLPGTWNIFEAGIRAILGQQISVVAARKLVTTLVEELGEQCGEGKLFPNPNAIANSSLDFFAMPGARKQTLRTLAQHFLQDAKADDPDTWLTLKGIGPWTANYARMRGLSDPDVYLGGDLGVKKAVAMLGDNFDPKQVSPWQSYLTIHLWSQL